MKIHGRTLLTVLILAVTALISVITLHGAELESGEWSGYYKMGTTLLQDVDYIVERDGQGSLSITMHNKVSRYPFSNIKEDEKKLSFTWFPGDEDMPVTCKLEKNAESGKFTGECPVPGEDEPIVMEMAPRKVDEVGESAAK